MDIEVTKWAYLPYGINVTLKINDERSQLWFAHLAKIILFDDEHLKIWYDGPSGLLKLEDKRRPDISGMMCTITTDENIRRWLRHYDHLTVADRNQIMERLWTWVKPPSERSDERDIAIEAIADEREARD